MQRRSFIKTTLAGAAAATLSGPLGSARAADKPAVIRVAFPGVGIGNRPFVGGGPAANLHLKGILEEEFKADGIKVQWSFLRGAGPAVNELYANGLVDISPLGDLPFIIGTAGGLKRKVLSTAFIRGNSYVVVPADSPISSLKDLRGKKVAIFKGTNIQLAFAQILEAHGLTEKDIRAINMDTGASRAAIVTKDIEAYVGGNDVLSLRDQGVAKLIYTTRGDPRFLRHGVFTGTEQFVSRYPEITQRIVNRLVAVSKEISEHDANPAPVFQLWTKSGVQFSNYKEDFVGTSLKLASSPLLDPYIVSQIKTKVSLAKRFGLIKEAFDFEALIDRRFLNKALKDQGLENYWPQVSASGKVS
ncbi:MAG TPA: ABC transporter substrate-binding protein [Polyangiaceae bacterium]|jgi:sulfonate transport system substrate-binding protein|nr:ABC transporter substrate-binding protein [Polyangiaceae bacterium]